MSIIQKVQKVNTILWIVCPWVFIVGYPILRLTGVINFKLDWFIWIGLSAIGLACSTFVYHLQADYGDDDD